MVRVVERLRERAERERWEEDVMVVGRNLLNYKAQLELVPLKE